MNTAKTTPKDFFLHLGATIALYASAIALMNLVFSVINRALPDQLSNYWSASSIVWPISMLIVLVPVLYILEWLVARDLAKIPEKKDIWVRKWRIFLTLFLTGVTIAGDLIVLINTYLNGEITSRFIYKVIVVLIVSAVIFAYYILERVTNSLSVKKWQMILSWVGIIIVLAGIVSGFVIVGSPATQRAMRFDDQRVNDLSNIQYQILNYWQTTGKLPKELPVLNDPISGSNIPRDPDTNLPYDYTVRTNNTFELCAVFSLSSDLDKNSNTNRPYLVESGVDGNWNHKAGKVCFNRTIDPERYPISPKVVPKI